jgi:hypothetical protein
MRGTHTYLQKRNCDFFVCELNPAVDSGTVISRNEQSGNEETSTYCRYSTYSRKAFLMNGRLNRGLFRGIAHFSVCNILFYNRRSINPDSCIMNEDRLRFLKF